MVSEEFGIHGLEPFQPPLAQVCEFVDDELPGPSTLSLLHDIACLLERIQVFISEGRLEVGILDDMGLNFHQRDRANP